MTSPRMAIATTPTPPYSIILSLPSDTGAAGCPARRIARGSTVGSSAPMPTASLTTRIFEVLLGAAGREERLVPLDVRLVPPLREATFGATEAGFPPGMVTIVLHSGHWKRSPGS